ncbi:nucleotide-diphospho-sugar transferase [Schizophyllum amplum]|uniref:Nucleotide-diphospho-sugar transferase n=1 Tax=Schizophyllum amplum TaxID=97359 RepID=A0A550CSE1_9AGAR|nr:nucleotide-diphospho-sugar transferase [Auriculariopsis ampla]
MIPRRRVFYILLTVLGLFLAGTVVVLSSITYYLSIDAAAYLSELEVPILENSTRWNASDYGQVERIPRIIHQTWKSETLPTRWKDISQNCRDIMPDYEYMLWTDAQSREFIAENYSWFLDTFDDYQYNIQRADAIRYFVLHHYGGVYIDLDIGCERPLDPLLVHSVILPKTIPVGVSNDLMFAEKGHPFLAQTIHNLVTFDHSWVLNYPTVMFSTGPMFLSMQYSIFSSSHPFENVIRILPKSLYGKNAKEGEAPHSFFAHYYGSSWHADDASFIAFLNHWGKGLMWVGLVVLIVGLVRMILPGKQRRHGLRLSAQDALFRGGRHGNWHIQLGSWSPTSTTMSASSPSSPDPESAAASEMPLLGLPFDVPMPTSPTSSEVSTAFTDYLGRQPTPSNAALDAFRAVRDRVAAFTGYGSATHDSHRSPSMRSSSSRRRRYSRGVLFFLPAIFAPTSDIELGANIARNPNPPPYQPRSPSGWSQRPEKDPRRFEEESLSAPDEPGSSRRDAFADSTALVDVDEVTPRRSTGPTPPRSRSASQQRL